MKYHSLIVVLDEDYNIEELAGLVNAIRQFRRVVQVDGHPSEATTFMAEQRALVKVREKLYTALEKVWDL